MVYPTIRIEGEVPCPAAEDEHVIQVDATLDERATLNRCPTCGARLWATLDIEAETIRVVEA